MKIQYDVKRARFCFVEQDSATYLTVKLINERPFQAAQFLEAYIKYASGRPNA